MLLQLRSRKKLFLLILVSAAAFVFFSPSLARLEGGELKDFTLLDVNGHKVRLFELANDKPLLLYFWASWCKPCRLVSPQIATLAREYKDRITVIGINVGGVDSPEFIKKYAKRHHMDYPLLIDSDNETLENYSIRAIPTIIFLDKNGKILFRGNEPPEKLEELLPK
ncbi:MAG: TlpA disulfide reductase family protein [Deltaproteobacteria bacterium]|jgi:thiol-disulfide isomerase/thioredoxin